METLSLEPLALLVRDYLSEAECARLIELAKPKLQASMVMGVRRARLERGIGSRRRRNRRRRRSRSRREEK